jgi:hypothetical protein
MNFQNLKTHKKLCNKQIVLLNKRISWQIFLLSRKIVAIKCNEIKHIFKIEINFLNINIKQDLKT